MRCAKFVLLIFITFVTIQACIGAGRHVAYAVLYNFVCIMYKKIQKICKILQKNTNYNVKIIKGFVKIFYSLKIWNLYNVKYKQKSKQHTKNQEVEFMRKKLLSIALCATMVAGIFTGCGSSSDTSKKDNIKRNQLSRWYRLCSRLLWIFIWCI